MLNFACACDKNDHVLADGTYKIIVEGFPVLTIGTTDRQRSIHHFGYAMAKVAFGLWQCKH